MIVTFTLLLPVGAPAVLFPATVSELVSGVIRGDEVSIQIFAGFAAAVGLHILFRKRSTYRFLCAHHHETAHLIFSILMFSAPKLFLSSQDGSGRFQVECPQGLFAKTRQFLISIAPYWFSPLAIVPILSCFAGFPTSDAGRIAIISVAGISLVLPISQIHPRQPDFREFGFVPSVCASLWFWCAQTVVLLAMLSTWSIRDVPRLYLAAWEILWIL